MDYIGIMPCPLSLLRGLLTPRTAPQTNSAKAVGPMSYVQCRGCIGFRV